MEEGAFTAVESLVVNDVVDPVLSEGWKAARRGRGAEVVWVVVGPLRLIRAASWFSDGNLLAPGALAGWDSELLMVVEVDWGQGCDAAPMAVRTPIMMPLASATNNDTATLSPSSLEFKHQLRP